MGTLELSSRKMFIKEMSDHYKLKASTGALCVWLQGIVVKSNEANSELIVDDGTGIIQVLGNDKIPNCPKVHKGQYVMVIGILISGGKLPVIRTFKVHDLSACVDVETMWLLEVIDQSLTFK